MRTGKLAISRGHQRPEPPRLALVPEPDSPPSPDFVRIDERLTALERLVRLCEVGALSPEEFAAKKRLVLGAPADPDDDHPVTPVHFVPAHPRRPARGPSLLGRMLSWQFMLLCLVVGLGFSFATQPDTTIRFFEQFIR
jgi:hypothetical protein